MALWLPSHPRDPGHREEGLAAPRIYGGAIGPSRIWTLTNRDGGQGWSGVTCREWVKVRWDHSNIKKGMKGLDH